MKVKELELFHNRAPHLNFKLKKIEFHQFQQSGALARTQVSRCRRLGGRAAPATTTAPALRRREG